MTPRPGVSSAGSVAEEWILDALTLDLLGSPEVTVGGAPLAVDTRKAIALLALVAVDGPQSRDLLVAMLWPDSDPARGRGALRRTLSVLNTGLGAGHPLRTDRMRVAIPSAGTCVDVTRFEELVRSTGEHGHREGATCAACIRPLSEAVALHRGEFLEGFTLRGTPDFEEWQGHQAERLRRRLTRTLDLLTRAAVDAGELELTATHLQRWLDVDPLNEQVHGRFMLLHAWRGERTEAIQRYRNCVAVLHRELGVAPLPQTNRLYQAVLKGRVERPVPASQVTQPVAVPSTPPSPPATAAPSEPVIVGRDHEIEILERHLGHGGGEIVTVVGEAGVGRTALVDHVGRRLRAAGRTVLFGRCRPGEDGIAYGALMDLLHTVLATPGALERATELPAHQLSEAARLLPELAELRADVPPAGQLGLPGAQARFLEAVTRLLATAVEPPDVPILIFEDMHTADTATLDVLTYAAHRLAGLGLSLVLTWRNDAAPTLHALQRCLADASVAPRVTAIVLARLEPEDTHRLCASLLPDGLDLDGLARRIHDEAQGVPLAVVEYARDVADAGLALEDPWPVPAGLRELVRGRLAELSDTAQQLAGAAALFGARFDLDTLVAAAGRTEEETIAGVESLLACGLIEPGADDGSYEFTHERVRTVVTADLTPVRRRSLHGRIVDAVSPRARRADGNALAAMVAEHARLAGRDEAAATWSVLAGDHARSVFAHTDAMRHYERALGASHPHPAEVHRRIAQLRVLNGEYRAGLQAYELAAAHTDDDRELAVVEHELAALHLRRGDAEASRAHLTVALDLLADDDPLRARVLADVSLTELESGDLESAAAAARRALDVAESSGDVHAIAQARNVAGIGARRGGDLREALRHLEHAAALATRLDDPSPHIAALNNLALTTADLGDLERAEQLFERAIARCAEQGDRHRQAALLNNLADLLHTQGREEDSRARLAAAVTMFAEVGDEPTRHPEVWKLVQW